MVSHPYYPLSCQSNMVSHPYYPLSCQSNMVSHPYYPLPCQSNMVSRLYYALSCQMLKKMLTSANFYGSRRSNSIFLKWICYTVVIMQSINSLSSFVSKIDRGYSLSSPPPPPTPYQNKYSDVPTKTGLTYEIIISWY